MHINYWNTKYEKKQQKQNTTPPCFVPNNISFYSLCPSVRNEAFASACACVYQMSEGRKCYANVSHKHLSNSAHMHLCCVQEHPFNVHILHTSMRLSFTSVLWSCGALERCADSVTVVFVALRDTCLPGARQNKKEKQTKWTWEACQYQTGDQSANNEISSPTVY